jgi:hypothetical protein
MKNKILCFIFIAAGALLLTATNGFSHGSLGDNVNSACAPVTPYTNKDCTLCHTTDKKSDPTDAKDAYSAGDTTLTNFFCPDSTPTCTDSDSDGFAFEGGECGQIDCDDKNSEINPDAVDIPNNGIDENCDDADTIDPALLDDDNDGYTPAEGDCDDTNPSLNPGVVEECTDGIDNNCNNLVDVADPAAVGCLVCTDTDKDGFYSEGGECGPVDCDDADSSTNPNGVDIPNNGIDEDCSGSDTVDPTLLDQDGDGFTIAAGDCDDDNSSINPNAVDIPHNGIDEDCSGSDTVDTTLLDGDSDGFAPADGDCDDTDASVNPNAVEDCTDGIDNNCNGYIDTQDDTADNCQIACTDVDKDSYAVDGGDCGPVDCDDEDAFVNPGSDEICGSGVDENCDGQTDCCKDYNDRRSCNADPRCKYSGGKEKSCSAIPADILECKANGGRWSKKINDCIYR